MAKTLEERPRTVPDPTEPKRRSTWWRPLFLGVTAVAALAVAAGSVYGYGLYKYADQEIRPWNTEGVPKTEIDAVSGLCRDTCTYLVLGSDSRAGLSKDQQSQFGSPETVPDRRSDTILLVRIDPRQERALVLSFPRDLWVKIPEQGMGKITSAFEGGPYRVAATIKRLTGIGVDHFLVVNLAGFESVVDAIGGVPICIDHPLVDLQFTGLNLPHAGCYNLGPRQALAFVRARHVQCEGGIPDFNRINRQQQFLRAVLKKVLNPSVIANASTVVPAVLKNIYVDRGLKEAGIAEIMQLVNRLRGIGTGAVDFRSVPGDPTATVETPEGTVDIVRMLPQARKLFARIRDGKPLGTLGKALPSTSLSPANVKVRVFDASSSGTAAKVDALLTRAGFDIRPVVAAGKLATRAPAILYRPGALDAAQVVNKFLPELRLIEAPPNALSQIDVAVVADASVDVSATPTPAPEPSPSAPATSACP